MKLIEKNSDKKEKNKKYKTMIVSAVSVFVIFVVLFLAKPIRYNIAMKLIKDENYSKAYELLYKIKDYKDTENVLDKFIKVNTKTIKHSSSFGDTIIQYSYDSNGNCTQDKTSSYSGEIINNYVYDSNNNCIKRTHNSSRGSSTETYENEYDSKNRIIKKRTHGNENGPYLNEYYYDYRNNINKEVYYYGKTMMTREYVYDSNNNCIKEVNTITGGSINGGGNKEVVDYIYDSNGNCVKKVVNNGNIHNEYKYVFDDNILIKEISDISEIEYIYDKQGNCVKEIETYDDGSQSITEHTGFKIFYQKNN